MLTDPCWYKAWTDSKYQSQAATLVFSKPSCVCTPKKQATVCVEESARNRTGREATNTNNGGSR